MKTYTQEELKKVLEQHQKWLNTRYTSQSEGERANMYGAYLERANLEGANLRGANLKGAYLRGADLEGADLEGANLEGANLKGANLKGANLEGAYLRGASMYGANLEGANLEGANLACANMYGANLEDATGLTGRSLVPEKGPFTAYKKVCDSQGVSAVLELFIPADAQRVSSYVGRKCRASKAFVVGVVGKDVPNGTVYRSVHDPRFSYVVGEEVKPDKFDSDRRVECTSGIHFFIESAEAEAY